MIVNNKESSNGKKNKPKTICVYLEFKFTEYHI